MQSFVKAGLDEYKNRKRAEQEFGDHTNRIKELLILETPERTHIALNVLTPLITIAWTDGKVGRHEQDAILKAADEYGILACEEKYPILMERLSTRPDRASIQKWWAELAVNCHVLNAAECTAFASHLYQQTK